jgi:hypothetical protein
MGWPKLDRDGPSSVNESKSHWIFKNLNGSFENSENGS